MQSWYGRYLLTKTKRACKDTKKTYNLNTIVFEFVRRSSFAYPSDNPINSEQSGFRKAYRVGIFQIFYIMKNKKFSIEVIEEGRLSRNESLEIKGGAPDCRPTYNVLCAMYTSCTPATYGTKGEDGTWDPFCSATRGAYTSCTWDSTDPKQTPYGL